MKRPEKCFEGVLYARFVKILSVFRLFLRNMQRGCLISDSFLCFVRPGSGVCRVLVRNMIALTFLRVIKLLSVASFCEFGRQLVCIGVGADRFGFVSLGRRCAVGIFKS